MNREVLRCSRYDEQFATRDHRLGSYIFFIRIHRTYLFLSLSPQLLNSLLHFVVQLQHFISFSLHLFVPDEIVFSITLFHVFSVLFASIGIPFILRRRDPSHYRDLSTKFSPPPSLACPLLCKRSIQILGEEMHFPIAAREERTRH